MRKTKNTQTATGSKRMRQLGYTLCQLWLSDAELSALKAGARAARQPLAGYARRILCSALGVRFSRR